MVQWERVPGFCSTETPKLRFLGLLRHLAQKCTFPVPDGRPITYAYAYRYSTMYQYASGVFRAHFGVRKGGFPKRSRGGGPAGGGLGAPAAPSSRALARRGSPSARSPRPGGSDAGPSRVVVACLGTVLCAYCRRGCSPPSSAGQEPYVPGFQYPDAYPRCVALGQRSG